MIIVLFGVSGAGKTTIGRILSQQLRWQFLDADDFHPMANIEKLREGIALTDNDRTPWLDHLRTRIEGCLASSENAIVACSALKKRYRDRLRAGPAVKFVFLRGDRALIEKQLRQRAGHFMNPDLLESQFADLEEPVPSEEAIIVDAGKDPRDLVNEIASALSLNDS